MQTLILVKGYADFCGDKKSTWNGTEKLFHENGNETQIADL
jgi:hypothetical protein